jgi:hypothetical protein
MPGGLESDAGHAVAALQLQMARAKRQEADLRKRMVNVLAAHNTAVEGADARRMAVIEKTKMIIARSEHEDQHATVAGTKSIVIYEVIYIRIILDMLMTCRSWTAACTSCWT